MNEHIETDPFTIVEEYTRDGVFYVTYGDGDSFAYDLNQSPSERYLASYGAAWDGENLDA